jgi:hypothetical protein
MEDWLYMEGEAEGGAEFRSKLQELKEVGDPMKNRAQVGVLVICLWLLTLECELSSYWIYQWIPTMDIYNMDMTMNISMDTNHANHVKDIWCSFMIALTSLRATNEFMTAFIGSNSLHF